MYVCFLPRQPVQVECAVAMAFFSNCNCYTETKRTISLQFQNIAGCNRTLNIKPLREWELDHFSSF